MNALAFAASILLGVACGYVLMAAEAIEDRLNARSHAAAKQTNKPA